MLHLTDVFGPFNFRIRTFGSRVLITTRDAHLLATLKVYTTYKVKKLDEHEALELFNQHAFRRFKLEEDYFELANQVIQYADGLPLALTIIGSDLCGRTKSEWENAIDQYRKIPERDIHEILKVSYDGLRPTEKDIFLDIACFFKGRNKDNVVNILDACNLYPKSGIPNLVNKCLITIDFGHILWMHDLVQQMGREIVRQESPKILKKRSRLWQYEDALEVLTKSKGSDEIRGIKLHSPNPITMQLHTKAFRKMENLKFLMVSNVLIFKELKYLPNGLKLLEWDQYHFSLPSNFCPQELVVLKMPHSCIRLEKLFKQGFLFKNLKSIDLEKCLSIRILPDLGAPNLEILDIRGCENLIEVHEAFGSLHKLERWYLYNCKKLQILPSNFRLKSLKEINLNGCVSLEKLPDLCAPNLEILDIRGCENLIEVHEAFGSLHKLERWYLCNCKKLQILPSSFRLESLEEINLYGCVSLEKLPDLGAPNLEILDIRGCENLIEVHEAFGSLHKLERWYLCNCKKLQILPSNFRLKSLEEINLYGCVSLEKLPDLGAPNLEILDIRGCENLIEVHEAFGSLHKLERWYLCNCKKLQILPSSFRLKSLEEINLYGCVSLEKLPDLGAPNLEKLDIRGCENLIEVHEAFGSLHKLERWYLCNCKKLQILPSSFSLNSLEEINLYGCVSLEKLPDLGAPNLEKLDIRGCENLIEVHEAFGSLHKLERWYLCNCKKLQILPSSFRLESLEEINPYGCVSLEKLPDLGAPNLEKLDIRGCENLIEVHKAFGSLHKLERCYLNDWKKLQILPSSFSLGFTSGLDDLGSSSIARICDNTELPPLSAFFSTSYGSNLDHGVFNNGGVSGHLIEPNFESTFPGDVLDLDSSSFVNPFASIEYNDLHTSDSSSFVNPFASIGYNSTLAPSVFEDTTIHHSLPVLPVNTTNRSELGLGRQDLGFSDGFDLGSSSVAHAFDNNDSDFNLFPPSKKTRTS
uniref:Disease resistance protein Roq1-like winged-helix domain-containing protein n=1 Tax=Quercus lobata TaxID=97700 RepID=A0A7N2M6N9_QUELO